MQNLGVAFIVESFVGTAAVLKSEAPARTPSNEEIVQDLEAVC